MKSVDLERRMRALEWFHGLRALPATWPIIRVDGRSFSRLTEKAFTKPFDQAFHKHMLAAAEALLEGLQGLYAFTESDEISILLPASTDLFDREVEKLVSVSAGIASSHFSLSLGKPAHFDARLWLGVTREHVVDYFRWRQGDATRCCLNGWCYWTLRKEGKSVKEATAALRGKGVQAKHDLLFERSVNFNDLPTWQKRGTGVYWQNVPKEGRNPITGEIVMTTRRRLHVDHDIPMASEYSEFIARLMDGPVAPRDARVR